MGLTPIVGAGVSISATDSSGNADLGDKGNFVTVTNAGDNGAYLRFGTSTVAATTSDLYIPSGNTFVLIRAAVNQEYLAAICDSGETATIKACPGYSE